jgi:hypothetical protein
MCWCFREDEPETVSLKERYTFLQQALDTIFGPNKFQGKHPGIYSSEDTEVFYFAEVAPTYQVQYLARHTIIIIGTTTDNVDTIMRLLRDTQKAIPENWGSTSIIDLRSESVTMTYHLHE